MSAQGGESTDLDSIPIVPPCIENARRAGTKDGLKLDLLWSKKKNIKITSTLKTYLNATGLELTAEEVANLLEEVENLSFSCGLAQGLGFCDRSACQLWLDPVKRLLNAVERVLWDPANAEFELFLNTPYGVVRRRIPINKFYKIGNSKIQHNTDLLYELYTSIYIELPEKVISEEDVARFLGELKENQITIADPTDEYAAIEQEVIDLLTGGYFIFYDVSALYDGNVSMNAAFVDNDVILIESTTLLNRLQVRGYNVHPRKLSRALSRITIRGDGGRSTRKIRTKRGRFRFWLFSRSKISLIDKGKPNAWVPEILYDTQGADGPNTNTLDEVKNFGAFGAIGAGAPSETSSVGPKNIEEDKEESYEVINSTAFDGEIDFDLNSILDNEEHPEKSPEKNLSDMSGTRDRDEDDLSGKEPTVESNQNPVEDSTETSAGEVVYNLSYLLKELNHTV